jgi:hypothetical protein
MHHTPFPAATGPLGRPDNPTRTIQPLAPFMAHHPRR